VPTGSDRGAGACRQRAGLAVRRNERPVRTVAAVAALVAVPANVLAGAPFRTDDPGVVARSHYEFLPFYSQTLASGVRSGALPGFELHYGALDNLEVDLVVAAAFDSSAGGSTQRGYGDTELALKYQFVNETETLPAMGFVPNFILPTGNAGRGLGNGGSQFFLPLWLEKRSGNFSTYGGGGYWINNGAGNRNYWFFGWQAQYQLSGHWILGGEIFHSTAQTAAQSASTGFSLGGFYVVDRHSQLLFSAGKGLQNAAQTNQVSTYLGYMYSY